MASSALHIISPIRPYQSPFSSSSSSSRRDVSAYTTSRRLALIQIGTVIPQSQLFGANSSTLLKSDVSTVANTAQPITEENALDWSKKDNRKMLHVVYRVGDLEKTIKFYTECLGMKVLRQRNIPEEKYANAFLGYGPEESNFVIELTYNYGVDKYNIGTGFGHFGIAVQDYTIAIMGYGSDEETAVLELTYNYGVTEYDKGNGYGQIAIGTDDVYKTAEVVKLFGGDIVLEPGPLPVINTKITACLDPDGWKSVFVDNIDFMKELE